MDPELKAAVGRLSGQERRLAAAVVRYWQRCRVRPIRLPCGCWLGPCPCCGRWELVLDAARACRYGGPEAGIHKALIREFACP